MKRKRNSYSAYRMRAALLLSGLLITLSGCSGEPPIRLPTLQPLQKAMMLPNPQQIQRQARTRK